MMPHDLRQAVGNFAGRLLTQKLKDMKSITFPLNYEVVNNKTGEIYDTRTKDIYLSEKDLREVARVMEENGGFAPELPVFQKLDARLFEICIEEYNENYAPADEHFWDEYTLEYDDEVQEVVLEAAEEYVTHKDVSVTFYYGDGAAQCDSVDLGLKPNVFRRLIETARKDHAGKTDFDLLAETDAEAYRQVKEQVAQCAGRDAADITLKEFPYQVLEIAISE